MTKSFSHFTLFLWLLLRPINVEDPRQSSSRTYEIILNVNHKGRDYKLRHQSNETVKEVYLLFLFPFLLPFLVIVLIITETFYFFRKNGACFSSLLVFNLWNAITGASYLQRIPFCSKLYALFKDLVRFYDFACGMRYPFCKHALSNDQYIGYRQLKVKCFSISIFLSFSGEARAISFNKDSNQKSRMARLAGWYTRPCKLYRSPNKTLTQPAKTL